MKNYKIILFILLIGIIIGCGFNYKVEVAPKYYMIEVDAANDLDLCYKLYNGDYIGLLGGGITNLYRCNNTFIAVRKVRINEGKIDEEKQYFIVPIYREDTLDPTKGIQGPFTIDDLNRKLKSNGMKFVQFKELNLAE